MVLSKKKSAHARARHHTLFFFFRVNVAIIIRTFRGRRLMRVAFMGFVFVRG